MIKGKRIILRAVEEEHLSKLLLWRNMYLPYFREYRVMGIEDQRRWWRDKILNDDSWQYFVACDQATVVGAVGLTYIHPIYQTAEFAITVGERYRGNGYGSDMLKTIIKHGFESLNLNRIWCEVYDNNEAIGLYRKIGFKDEGTLRQHVYKDGKYLDAHVLGMLREDYKWRNWK